jgi:hypothetical protein
LIQQSSFIIYNYHQSTGGTFMGEFASFSLHAACTALCGVWMRHGENASMADAWQARGRKKRWSPGR